jgi:hypothetical protein
MIDYEHDFDESDHDEERETVPDLGPCCCCGRTQDGTVRTLVMLDFRAPAGHVGWGCVVCGLESAGAGAVVCDACVDAYNDVDLRERLKWISGGRYAGERVRVPLAGFARVPHEHDMSKHPECLACS